MTEVHIGKKGTEVVVPAGYMNRAMRRRMKKLDMHHVHRVIEKPCTKNENKESGSVEVAN